MKHSTRIKNSLFPEMRSLTVILLLALSCMCANAQVVAVKTNVLSYALLTANAGIEAKLAPKHSIELSGSLNAWELDHGNKMWKHWYAMPELRYWFCDVWDGHFIGVHTFGGQYNIGGVGGLKNFLGTDFSKVKDSRYQGWFVGAGIAYGYDWIINRHWNIEAEIGIGWAYTRWDKFRCAGCGKKEESKKPHNYVGPTKAALNVIYIF